MIWSYFGKPWSHFGKSFGKSRYLGLGAISGNHVIGRHPQQRRDLVHLGQKYKHICKRPKYLSKASPAATRSGASSRSGATLKKKSGAHLLRLISSVEERRTGVHFAVAGKELGGVLGRELGGGLGVELGRELGREEYRCAFRCGGAGVRGTSTRT